MRDKHQRSIIKAFIYRGGSVTLLGFLSWITTKDIVQVSIITIGYQVVSVFGYYIYERLWDKINWGRKQ